MRKYIFFLGIIIVSATLRFIYLGQNPPSLTWDEAAWGYNAYALLTTGRDEFGRSFPLDYFESFGDYKPPVYAYLTVVSVAAFGLNEFAIRFPSAFFGVLAVSLTYFLVSELFFSSPNRHRYALFSSLFLAVSPWHINLSRAAFEANVATTFIIAGVLFFLLAVRKSGWYFVLSAISFALSVHTFNTSRIVSPLLVVLLLVTFFKQLKRKLLMTVVACFVGILILLPAVNFFLSPYATLRYKEVNIFTDPEPVIRANTQQKNSDFAYWSKILSNRRVFYAREYLKHYFDNLNPLFLFIKGDGNPKFSTQQVGQMYVWDIPFLIIGSLFLFRRKEGHWFLLPVWFLLGIIPAAAARETPHALRIETIIPILQIITAYGFVLLLQKIAHRNIKYLLFSFAFLCLIINFLYYIHGYFAHYPRQYSGEWQYGYKEAIQFIASNARFYKKVYLTDALGRPYIYYLLYTKTSPRKLQTDSRITRDVFGFVTVHRVGKVYFQKDFALPHAEGERILFINTSSSVPDNAHILRIFSLLNGTPSLVAYTL